MANTIEFNTGRKYTAEDQLIKATLHDDGVVTFFDHSRMVDGEFKLGLHCTFNQAEVMHWYDSGMAQGTKRSWADGMLRGGCNAREAASDAAPAAATAPLKRFYIQEKRSPRGKFTMGNNPRSYGTEAEAFAMLDDLAEHGGCGPLRVVDQALNVIERGK